VRLDGIAALEALERAEAEAQPSPAWPDPPDEAAYHGLAGDVVRAIEPHTEAAPVALLAQFLVAFGNAAGRSAYFVAEADKHYSNLFVCLVGATAKGRKGSSWGHILRLFEAADPEWAQHRVQHGLSSGEGAIWAVRDPIARREAIREKGRVVDYQEVEDDPGVADKRLLVVEAEFASVLRVATREGNTLSQVLRQAWDMGTLRTLVKHSPARATGAHISVIGHITREELLRHLDTTEAANGFGNRFLWLCVRRAKALPEGGRFHEVDVAPLVRRLREALARSRTVGEVRRDEEARAIWRAVYPSLSEGKPGLLGAMIARAEAQVMRLALIYALLDGSAAIGRPHLKAALALWDYAEASARHIFGEALGDPVADTILGALKADGGGGLTRTEIHGLFSRNVPASRIGRALAALAAADLARVRRDVETGGRPADRWFYAGVRKNEESPAP